MKEQDFPCFYVDSNNASGASQKRYKVLIWLGIALMFFATLVESIEYLKIIKPYVGYAVFASGLASLMLTLLKPEKGWYKGRAIAESIKTLTWRYMMHVPPFEDLNDDGKNLLEFTNRLNAINTQANQEGFIPKPNAFHTNIITPEMEMIRNKNLLERKEYYKINRIENQIHWYNTKSRKNKLMAAICSWSIVFFQIIAGIYLLKNNGEGSSIDFNTILVFVATSLIAIVELYKFKDLHQAYALTYQELIIIKARFGTIHDQSSLSQFVLEAEQAISREHTMWLARRGS